MNLNIIYLGLPHDKDMLNFLGIFSLTMLISFMFIKKNSIRMPKIHNVKDLLMSASQDGYRE